MSRWCCYRDRSPIGTPEYLGDVEGDTKADAIAAGEQLHDCRVVVLPASTRSKPNPDAQREFARTLGARATR